MFPYSCILLFQLFGVATASGIGSVETAGASHEKTLLSHIADGFYIWFDDAVCDAFMEGILALAVFGLSSVVLRRCRRYKTKQHSKAKLASLSRSSTSHSYCPPDHKTKVKHEVGVGCSKTALSTAEPTLATQKGTKLGAPSNEASQKTFHTSAKRVKQADADSLVAAIRSGKASQLNDLLDSAYARAIIATEKNSDALETMSCDLLLASLRACASSRSFDFAILAYDHMASRIGKGSGELLSVLLYNLAEVGAFNRCKDTFEKLCLLSSPSGYDIANMLRCYIGSQDLVGLHEALASLRNSGHSITAFTLNRALAACSSATTRDIAEELVSSGICVEGLDSVGYNSLMKCNARAGRLDRCFQLRAEMLAKGTELSEVTYGILLDACVGAEKLDHARKIFDDLCGSGLQLNVVHCTTFIKALVGAGQVDEASRVLQEMACSKRAKPDLITYSTIVKAHAEKGNVSSALQVLEDMIQAGVNPDEIIFNSVLSACSIFPMKSTHLLSTFETLVTKGMRPTTTTLSIFLKGLILADAYELSLQVLDEATAKFGIAVEIRLYMQLARACIKARSGTALLKTFKSMLNAAKARGQKIESSDVSILLRNCALGGQLQIAADLQRVAQASGITIEPQAEKLLKSVAARRGRFEKKLA